MAILTGPAIRHEVAIGGITVSPYDKSRVQPNSIDLTLGTGVCVYSDVVEGYDDYVMKTFSSYEKSKSVRPARHRHIDLDVKLDNPVDRFEMDCSGWILQPGLLYLMHVVEELHAPDYVMTLDGKSSLARLGIIVHFTAGHAETGFQGQYTLEVSAMHAVRIYPGMPIAQVIFTTIEGEREDYKERGNYVGEKARGAQPSRSWRHFK